MPESDRRPGSGTLLKNKGFYVGGMVGGRYELLRELGENNSGWVFQAEDTQDGSKLRLLVLQADWATDPAALTQIEREVEKLRGIENPNILRVLGIERVGGSQLYPHGVDGWIQPAGASPEPPGDRRR